MRIINIFANDHRIIRETKKLLKRKLKTVTLLFPSISIPCGAHRLHRRRRSFLETLHKQQTFGIFRLFGINTGHLGFFRSFIPMILMSSSFGTSRADMRYST
jgi:hypothetical protein